MTCIRLEQFTRKGTVRCPCRKCKCRRFLDIEPIRYHLYKDGFKPDYWVQTEYREALPPENQFGVDYVGSSSREFHVGNEKGGNVTQEDNLTRYQGIIFYAVGHEFGMYSKPSKEVPNLDDKKFYSLLELANRPLWEGMCIPSCLQR